MLKERLKEIREELNQFEDGFSKYSFLVQLSAYVSGDQSDLMIDEYLYEGCQSQVWLRLKCVDNTFQMKATSDTLIIRGILYIMMELYNGCPISEIAELELDFLKTCGIEEHFSSERTMGIQGIIEQIRDFCAIS